MRPVSIWIGVGLGLVGLALLAGGCSKPEETGTVLVEVGKTPINREKVDQAFLGLPAAEQKQYLDRAGRRQLLDNLVTLELLYQEALRQKLDQDPKTSAKLEAQKRETLVDALINRSIMPADLYRMFQEGFIKARSLIVELPENPSAAVEAQAQAEADKLYADLKKGTAWEELAERKVPPPLLVHDQDWGYINRERLGQSAGFEVQEAAFAVKQAGEPTRPVKANQAWVITQVQETSGNLNPEGFTQELGESLLAQKKEEVYRGYVTDLRSRRQDDLKPNPKNIEEFLSIGDRAASPQTPAAGSTLEPGGTEAPAPGAAPASPSAPAALPAATAQPQAPGPKPEPSPVPAP